MEKYEQGDDGGKSRKRPKYRQLTLYEKAEVIKLVEKGEKKSNVAKKFGIVNSSITSIVKNQEKYKLSEESLKLMKNKTRIDTGKQHNLEKLLFQWFKQQRTLGIPVSGPLIKEKALFFNRELGGPETFRASQGWLSNFKSRFGIRQISVQGEKLSADHDGATEFKETIQVIADGNYSKDNIYNADETGLNFKLLPQKTLTSLDETEASGYKQPKDQVTLMVSSNASDSHKVPLMVGKSNSPRCFKNVKQGDDDDCRICFNKDDELTDLFAGVILGENIVTAIMECTSVEIQHNDRYSPMICASCLDKLHIALQFRMMCVESNKRLQNEAEQTSEDATENDDIEEMPVKVEIHTEDEDHLDNSSTTFIPETSSKTLVDLSSNTNDKEQFSKEVPNNSGGHSASSLYKCESCGKILTNAKSMDRHVRTHLGDKRHECDICHRKFLFKYLVERHKAVKHSDKPTTARKPAAQSQEKTVECPFCSKKFFRNCQLKEHFRLHTGETPYMCDTCGKKFRTLDCLKKHTTVHTGFKKNYKCDICSKVFHTTRYLKRHIASIHEGLRPFECNVCRKRFRQQSYLDIHQLTHTGERPHRCDVCGRAFARSYTLTAHRRIHTGDRPHKCYVCGAAFAQRTPLRTHLKRHGVDDTENKLLATEFS